MLSLVIWLEHFQRFAFMYCKVRDTAQSLGIRVKLSIRLCTVLFETVRIAGGV